MIQPKNKLPWKITYDIDALKNKNYFIMNEEGTTIISADSYYVRPPHIEDAEYIAVAVNQYPVLLEFLERLEANTTDKETADKIRTLLIEQGLWK